MTSENVSTILTHSQELQLLSDHDIGSMMTLFDEPSQEHPQPVQPYLFDNQEHQQQIPIQPQFNDVLPYQIPDLLPALVPAPPAVPPSVLSNEDYEGPFRFEVFIDPHGSKNPWVYSSTLNKLFITVANPFPIDFKWDAQIKNFYVRATPLFSLAQHAQELVTRCIPHTQGTYETNRNVPQHIWDHVVRCQSVNAEYHGSKEERRHLNVLVPLGVPQTGTDTVRHMYSFMCQNSCPSGMNRKPFEVIFTLEDEIGTVYGRRKLNVRVCSCPKRDKEKEEKDYLKEIDLRGAAPPGKRRKTEKVDKKPSSVIPPLDTTEFTGQITICGKQNFAKLVRMAYDMMAGDLLLHGPNADVQKVADNLKKQLKELE
ncbi:hypothetical protein ILUMI_21883 [Ignelater luminosus]|uniref:p53 DNA-binding domain-containing protein n=1 Tax=Ignelater luminosus TaxID=2038154 RepID=A0A8K0CFK4_IGNLU|nr:hypothetical protein ILUMI_21883 [Ignelater luminosus]